MKNSNFKTFRTYKTELKSLSNVINKFDFDDFVKFLLNEKCIGNFNLFDKECKKGFNFLGDSKKRYAFISFALPHLIVNKGNLDKTKISESQLVDLIKVLFELKEADILVSKRGKYLGNHKFEALEVTQIGLKSLKTLWNKASAKKQENNLVTA